MKMTLLKRIRWREKEHVTSDDTKFTRGRENDDEEKWKEREENKQKKTDETIFSSFSMIFNQIFRHRHLWISSWWFDSIDDQWKEKVHLLDIFFFFFSIRLIRWTSSYSLDTFVHIIKVRFFSHRWPVKKKEVQSFFFFPLFLLSADRF